MGIESQVVTTNRTDNARVTSFLMHNTCQIDSLSNSGRRLSRSNLKWSFFQRDSVLQLETSACNLLS